MYVRGASGPVTSRATSPDQQSRAQPFLSSLVSPSPPSAPRACLRRSHFLSVSSVPMDPIRQLQENAAPGPHQQYPPPTNLEQPGFQQPPQGPAPSMLVEIIRALLEDRSDAASILAQVAVQLSVAQSSPQPLASPPSSSTGLLASSPPTVQLVKEVTRADRDAALREQAVQLSPALQPPDANPFLPPPVAAPSFITIDNIPTPLLASPSIDYIMRVLEARLDPSFEVWQTRAFYEEPTVTEYRRWSDGSGQPHRDMAEALATLSDVDELGVSRHMQSPTPDVAAEAWHHYRARLINALHRAFAAGVDWRRALRSFKLLYSDPENGHPIIRQYIASAQTDNALMAHPPLHADVLIYRLDEVFAAGSELYGTSSHRAEWERTWERFPGEDVLTLAIRVTEAFLKKLSDPKWNVNNLWESNMYTNEINDRYYECLKNDSQSTERAVNMIREFSYIRCQTEDDIRAHKIEKCENNLIKMARRLKSIDTARARVGVYDLNALDGEPPQPPEPPRHGGPTGRGARDRRNERRANERLTTQSRLQFGPQQQ